MGRNHSIVYKPKPKLGRGECADWSVFVINLSTSLSLTLSVTQFYTRCTAHFALPQFIFPEMELVCSVQKYEWGKKGEASAVAQLAKDNRNEPVEKETPYAELWMGVHPNGPSVIKHKSQSLNQVIEADPNLLGTAVVSNFGAQLPYLFKVLSVEKALSIQAHPSKSHAEELFKKFPTVYKDPNHKPEIAIALTAFEALCGFKPRQEISEALKNVAELKEILSEELVNDFVNGGASIRPCFEALMKAEPLKVKSVIDRYLLTNDSSVERRLIGRLNAEYAGDVGVLCVFWLNYVVLKPGEALFLAPNEPHAYIHGDCVECMSSSDNVVRAGLTPKFR